MARYLGIAAVIAMCMLLSGASAAVREDKIHRARSAPVVEKRELPSDLLETRRGGTIPPVVNWTAAGAVTPVEDQGDCGEADVAFAAAGNVEGVNFATNSRLVPLSVQEILSCASGGNGCAAGFLTNPLHWFLKNTKGDICTASSFPYNATGMPPCNTRCPAGAKITQVIALPVNEDTITSVVALTGPVAVAVNAIPWEMYQGGVLTGCSNSTIDHAALIVGYDNTHNPPYWLVKNSWGLDWGEEGYIRIAKGSNQCGIAQYASTVRVQKK